MFSNSGIISLLNSLINNVTTVFNDAPEVWGINFQDAGSPQFAGIVDLHNNIMFYLIVIAIAVFWVLAATIVGFNSHSAKFVYKYMTHGTIVETIWTILPAFVLLAIAFPSFRLLYLLDEISSPTLTIKAVGHQWYWSYEYSDYVQTSGEPIEFDSYMVPTPELIEGEFRNLAVDNAMVVPTDTEVRIIVTSTDVIHSFGVPALGLKIDATPGRLNQASFLTEKEGVYYGQCSELCGVAHGFMPIMIESVDPQDYLVFLGTLLDESDE